jgi:hypothetical protein
LIAAPAGAANLIISYGCALIHQILHSIMANNPHNNNNKTSNNASDLPIKLFIPSYLEERKAHYQLNAKEVEYFSSCSFKSLISSLFSGAVAGTMFYSLLREKPNNTRRPIALIATVITAGIKYSSEQAECSHNFVLTQSTPLAVDTRNLLRYVYPNNEFNKHYDKNFPNLDQSALTTGQNFLAVSPNLFNQNINQLKSAMNPNTQSSSDNQPFQQPNNFPEFTPAPQRTSRQPVPFINNSPNSSSPSALQKSRESNGDSFSGEIPRLVGRNEFGDEIWK